MSLSPSEATHKGSPYLVRGTLLQNHQVAPSYHKMRIRTSIPCENIEPGQFLMVRVSDQPFPLLRRPFSIHSMAALSKDEGSDIEILYKIVGRGTNLMANWKRGKRLDILGPLGSGFSLPTTTGTQFLVAGGIGVAGLFALSQRMMANGHTCLVFIGGKTREHVLCVDEFKTLGADVYVATEDGGLGFRGMITDMVVSFLRDHPTPSGFFACGPLDMLKALAHIAQSQSVPCQVSLETRMACGLGACLGCVIRTRGSPLPGSEQASGEGKGFPYKRVCKEGPVFDSEEVDWGVI
jgi:dihydroorotate dehydrogenase electron transfer subunit